ncbi:hypothetical protein V6N11_038701 [Hibiscus sabdariffa]|uniref:Uncharacterized protein n=1 Tax=Hibiscus sabdariffa TaxID=183260 RepID=A0ABR2SKQ7_9ROSI
MSDSTRDCRFANEYLGTRSTSLKVTNVLHGKRTLGKVEKSEMFNPTPKYCTYHPVNAGVIDPSHEFQTELLDISGITEKQNYFDKAQKSINGGDFMPLGHGCKLIQIKV